MHWDWILSPLTQYGALAAGLIACLTLFITTKLEIFNVERRVGESGDSVIARLQAAEDAVERLREATADAGGRQLPRWSSLNLTKRAQAIRMHRRGEPVETIAAAMEVPRNEVQLLIKLHDLQQPSAG